MVSHALGLATLNRVVGAPEKDPIMAFHQVLLYDEDASKHPYLVYCCLGRDSFALVDVVSVSQGGADMRNMQSMVHRALVGKLYRRLDENRLLDRPPFPTVSVPYQSVAELVVDGQYESLFGIVLAEDAVIPPLARIVRLGSCYRKDVIRDLQAFFSANATLRSKELATLRIRFVGGSQTDPRLALRHPAMSLFDRAPGARSQRQRLFFRAGYLFALPVDTADAYELLEGRPCSTYYFNKPTGKRSNSEKQMVVRILPPRALHPTGVMSELEFQLWTENIAHAVAAHEFEVSNAEKIKLPRLRGSEAHSPEEEEQLAAAEAEKLKAYVDSYFVSESGPYRKKMNIVGDQAAWQCFAVRILASSREIGVIGVRRKYIPPLCDTYQDMVFILFGDQGARDDDFMRVLEDAVDSLSPASAAASLQTRLEVYGSDSSARLGPTVLHPTYYDRVILQARADALLLSRDLYSWLKNRPAIRVKPRTKFIDLECNKLAKIFCNAIIALLPNEEFFKVERKAAGAEGEASAAVGGGGAGGAGGGGEKRGAKTRSDVEAKASADREKDDDDSSEDESGVEGVQVKNPLSIIFRMLSQKSEGADEDAATGGANGRSNGGAARAAASAENALEDWRRRISQYCAYCVDGGTRPDKLTFQKIVDAIEYGMDYVEPKDRHVALEERARHRSAQSDLDRVMEFLLYLSPTDSDYQQAESVHHKLEQCFRNRQPQQVQLTFNEWVMVRFLETGYLENVGPRARERGGETDKKNRLQPGEFTQLLCYILTQRRNNLELVKAAISKVINLEVANDEGRGKKSKSKSLAIASPAQLFAPLQDMLKDGNIYLKNLALRALASLVSKSALRQRAEVDPLVKLAVSVVIETRSPSLLSGALMFLRVVYVFIYSGDGAGTHPLRTRFFADLMLNLLTPRVNSKLRHTHAVLSEVTKLVLLMCQEEEDTKDSLCGYLISKGEQNGIIKLLIDLISQYDKYRPILNDVAGTLAIVLRKRPLALREDSLLKARAQALIMTLGGCAFIEQMKALMCILQALLLMLDINGFTDDVQERFLILRDLVKDKKLGLDSKMESISKLINDARKEGSAEAKAVAAQTQKKLDQLKTIIDGGNAADWVWPYYKKQLSKGSVALAPGSGAGPDAAGAGAGASAEAGAGDGDGAAREEEKGGE
jgi:hypothetical protein